MEEITKRNALRNVSVAVSVAGLGIGTVSGSRTSGSSADFDPSQLNEIADVWQAFNESDDTERLKILNNLEDNQKEAFLDAGRERYRVVTQRLARKPGNGNAKELAGSSFTEKNRHLPQKWGWDISSSVPIEEQPLGTVNGIDTQNAYCDSGTADFAESIESTTWAGGHRWTWEHEITWDWNYCSDGHGETYDNEVDNGRNSNRVLSMGPRGVLRGWFPIPTGKKIVPNLNIMQKHVRTSHTLMALIQISTQKFILVETH